MKIFISWSGEQSQEIAQLLSQWIPSVIQVADVFFSPEDIAKGENWNARLNEELNASNFGIVCLTKDNVNAPWVHFESGALAKALDSRVTSLMIGVKASDVKGPLSRFQNTKLEKQEMKKLIESINNSADKQVKPEILSNTFEGLWSNFEKDVNDVLKKKSSEKDAHDAGDESMPSNGATEEILRLVRKIHDSLSPSDRVSRSLIYRHLINHVQRTTTSKLKCFSSSVQTFHSI